MTTSTRWITLGLAALLAGAPAMAQDSTRTPRRAPGQPREAMRQRSPGLGGERGLARLRAQLGLSEAQVQQLEALRVAQRARPTREPDLLRARADYVQALQGTGDVAAARRALERLNAIRTDEQVARLEARQRMRAILTAEQRTTLDAMRERRGMGRGLREGRGRGGRGAMRGPGAGRRGGAGGFGPGMMPGAMRDGSPRSWRGWRGGPPSAMPPRPPVDESMAPPPDRLG
jgi:Spy/CpxP family protein refolding chaperone